jgi:hypothetical protein
MNNKRIGTSVSIEAAGVIDGSVLVLCKNEPDPEPIEVDGMLLVCTFKSNFTIFIFLECSSFAHTFNQGVR